MKEEKPCGFQAMSPFRKHFVVVLISHITHMLSSFTQAPLIQNIKVISTEEFIG